MRLSFLVRLLALRLWLLLGGRGRAIEELFAATASSFGRPMPPRGIRFAKARLAEYGAFTRRWAEEALESGEDLSALDRRLFEAASSLGSRLRALVAARSLRESVAASRAVYRGCLGIDLKGDSSGRIVVSRCFFAAIYPCRVCILISALDRGLLAGLSGGRRLEFQKRLTEGANCCMALLSEAPA